MVDTASGESPQAIAANLRREFILLACLGAAGLSSLALLLAATWHWQTALQWLAQSAAAWAYLCYEAAKRLDLNRPDPDTGLYTSLGWANRLTLLRAWLIATVAGFLFQAWPAGLLLAWLPGMLYFAAAMLDRVDGYVARRTRHSSLLGIELDTVSDAFGLAIAAVLAWEYGQVHASYLLVGVAYYVFQGGLRWRKRQGLPIHPLPPAMHRRAWAGFQMGFLVVALWPLFYPPLTAVAGFAFMTPVLVGFVIDWLIVSGRMERDAERVDRRFLRLTQFSHSWLQPALRLTIAIGLVVTVLQSGYPPMAGSGIPWFGTIITAGFALCATMVVLGIAGTYFCLLLIGLLGWYYINHPLLAIDYLLFCCVVWSMMLGTGRFSLWQEDEHWINRYDGA